MRVTDRMVDHWLVWARNFGEIVAWNNGTGTWGKKVSGARRFRIRLTAGVTADGAPYRPRQGIFDLLGHDAEDVVPPELMLTAREALVFGMGCAVGRAAAMAGAEEDWQRDRQAAWTPEIRAAFAEARNEARAANKADLERDHAEWEADRLRRVDDYRRRREAASRVLEDGENPQPE